MKKIFLILMLVGFSWGLTAETVLVFHRQSFAHAHEVSPQSQVSAAIMDTMFDHFFNQGDIVFDTAFGRNEVGEPTASTLADLAAQYGVDKVLYYHLVWTSNAKEDDVLDHLEYQWVTSAGQVLSKGQLPADQILPSRTDLQQSKFLSAALTTQIFTPN